MAHRSASRRMPKRFMRRVAPKTSTYTTGGGKPVSGTATGRVTLGNAKQQTLRDRANRSGSFQNQFFASYGDLKNLLGD